MTTSTFDPDTFLSQNVDGPMSTEFRLCPEGEYQAMIDDFDSKAFSEIKWDDKQTGESRSSPMFACPFVILDDRVKAELEREKIVVPAKMFLDMDGAALSAKPDTNIMLGRIRAAVGQNSAGAWTFSQLKGAGPVMVRVAHRSDKKDPSRKFAEVTRVAPIR